MNASKKNKRREQRIRLVVIIAIVVGLLAIGVIVLRNRVTARYALQNSDEVLSAAARRGSISTTVSGSGNLRDEDVEDIELYAGVEIEEIHVEAGDKIAEGDLLADVDMPSVLSSMAELQEQLDELDEEIRDASDDVVSSYISSSVAGRVKAVYARNGDGVPAVMYEHGSLATLSLDGYMAVDVETTKLADGDKVYVETESGTRYNGEASAVSRSQAVILISDNGPLNGEAVTVYSQDDELLGSGELYIHQPLEVTGYAGTISAVYARENSLVYAGSTLFVLTDTGYSAKYDSLLRQRGELLEQLQQLVVIYREGAVYAHSSGSISSVGESVEQSSASQSSVSQSSMSSYYMGMGGMLTGAATATQTSSESADTSTDTDADTQVLLSICPDKTMTVSLSVDETDILSLSLGQEAGITVDSIGEEEFSGTVTKIEKTGTASNGVTRYTAEVTLDKAEKMLSGMSASVVIRIEGIEDALLIPSDALHQTSSSSYVYTSYDETTGEYGGMKEVTAGMDNGSYVEIIDGLREGDVVYYTQSEDFFFGFGGMGGMPGGGMPGGRGFN